MRGQMATFIVNAVESTGTAMAGGGDRFSDDDGTTHEASINKVAAAGIALGVGGSLYAPTRNVGRDQMATFLMQLLGVAVDRGAASVPAT